MLLGPLIEAGQRECYALCAALAAAATSGTGPKPENGMYVFEVADTFTGQPGQPEDMPPDLRFAGQFAVAYANGDTGMARALFDALAADADTEDGMDRVVDGVLALYQMAVATTHALVAAQRSHHNQEED